MQEYIIEATNYLKTRPFCETFICLWNKKPLRDGVMPVWLTKLINWTISE